MSERSFLFEATTYLTAAVVFVPLSSRLRLGAVLGYLFAGCLIGPFGLGLIRDIEAILHFAEFGVVLMLFVIGLELDPERLWAMRARVFGGGFAQMLVCGALLSAGSLAIGLPWKAAVIAGFALALSSTAIAVQTLTERGLLGSTMGKTAFGILLFQDIAAIPLIGIVPLLSSGPAAPAGALWLGIAKVAAAAVGVVLIGRYATRPALRAIAKTNLREIFTAFALLLVIAISLLMDLAGVSMALGAFLAGVLLASSEYRHALETDIQPFKGLLMGLFFIAVGMSIDFELLARRPGLLVVLVLGLTGLKAAAIASLSPRVGVPRGQHTLFAGLLSQGSEFAFVVFGVAGQVEILPGEWGKILTLVVALSMVMTPLLVLASDLLQRRRGAQSGRAPDRIEAEDAPVIIAGFGRFGQVVGRLLFASRLKATVLDHDPDNIDTLRRFGFRVFYGDATRMDLLDAAGARQAAVIVNAIDDIDANLRLVDIVQREFPNLRIIARARNVTHWLELRARGIAAIERETFESAVLAGRRALEALGVHPYEARERGDRFRRYNLATLETLRADLKDEHRIATARAAREELERQFEKDEAELERQLGSGWGRLEKE
jgi:glutathione-regulated potassium-efflux system protein KefC